MTCKGINNMFLNGFNINLVRYTFLPGTFPPSVLDFS